mmetsp:Transcript_183026/g.580090  ORF Transcript_183026/g.580090 Transcript_183026/m.580090 type:complete len:207 (+) Transcript_183026:37-657(+)
MPWVRGGSALAVATAVTIARSLPNLAATPPPAGARWASSSVEGWKLAVVARNDLGMSPGKLAAQVAHAVHEVLAEVRAEGEVGAERLAAWEEDGAAIVVLQATSEEELQGLDLAARNQGLSTADVWDAGATEVSSGSLTALAVGPDMDSHVNAITGRLSAYRSNSEAEALRNKLREAETEVVRLRARLAALENPLQRKGGRIEDDL